MLSNQYNKVKEFHQVFGHPVADTKQYDLFGTNKKLVNFRISLINEEANELMTAYQANDLVEFVDALSDILYVVYGAGLVFGMHFDHVQCIQTVVTHTNKSILQDTNLRDSLYKSDSLYENGLKLYDSTFDEFEELCCNIIKQVYELAMYIQVNINDCFAEVHRSNMTKVCTTEEDAIMTVGWYKENEKRYEEPSYRKTDQYYVIFDKKTSKILKSRKYEEAQPGLTKILYGSGIE